MPETRPSLPSAVAALQETLSRDGHLTENVVAVIAHSAAQVRRFYPNLIEAVFHLQDAMVGKHNKIPRDYIDALTWMGVILNNPTLSGDAQNAGITCSPNQARELDEAFHRGFADLRQVALQLTCTPERGQKPVILAERIKAFPTSR